MRTLTASTTTAPASQDAGAAAHVATDDCPQYSYIGEGRFLPANDAAREECRRFNAWADDINARARGGIAQ